MKIIDIGCGPNGRSFENLVSHNYEITGIDLYEENQVKMSHPNFKYKKQDAKDLSIFKDQEFDLAISIGMMEHICDRNIIDQMYFEINRVAKQWVIGVPWKYTIIEPHFKFPFFQLFPYNVKVSLAKTFNLHDLRSTVTKDYNYINNHYQWLTNSEWLKIWKGGKCFITPFLDLIIVKKLFTE